ncbi:LysR family transcriptional regulator [Microbacterium sp.]|uniref:LysR family transcriptional regulator n=1 Tax=Microbacterium sp. TaxID=51671 RepID=UPI003C78DF2D
MIDHRLATLRAFALCGTVSATAELVGASASTVSTHLRELQREFGVKLVTKDGRGLRLTSAGRRLVTGSDALVEAWERIRADVLRGEQQGPIAFGIGGFSTAAANLLAPLAGHLRETQAGARVHVIEADPERCLELLAAERLDLALVIAAQATVTNERDDRFDQVSLFDDPLDVMMPTWHTLASRKVVTLRELAREDWITDQRGGPYRALFTAAFTAAGVTPRIAHEAVEWETAIALVGAGMGMGLVPRLMRVEGFENVVRVGLSGPERPSRRVLAVVRRGSMDAPLVQESLRFLNRRVREVLAHRRAVTA